MATIKGGSGGTSNKVVAVSYPDMNAVIKLGGMGNGDSSDQSGSAPGKHAPGATK